MEQYLLQDKFDYASGSGMEEAQFIELVAPTRKSMEHYSPIKSAFMQAVNHLNSETDEETKENAAKNTDDADKEIDAEGVINMMYSCPDVDMNKVFLHADNLFKFGAGKIDGEEKITKPIIEKMSMRDVEGLLGKYIATFIVPSPTSGR